MERQTSQNQFQIPEWAWSLLWQDESGYQSDVWSAVVISQLDVQTESPIHRAPADRISTQLCVKRDRSCLCGCDRAEQPLFTAVTEYRDVHVTGG